MSEQITINLTQPKEEIKFSYTEQGEEISFSFSEAARGPQGEPGASATVDQTIIDGSTNAVSGNAVFDGLALKAPIANPTFTGIVTAPRITGRCDGLEVFCKAGLAINAGQVVYVTGAAGNNIIIGLAQANAEPTSSKTIGISESTLALNATGYAITEGLLTVSISAPAAVEGDPIWLSPTTAGGMVFGSANKPSAPNHIVYLGVVTRKTGNTVVEIYVKIQNGAELDELADVAITSPAAGQALMRGATLWENRSLVAADIGDLATVATTGAYSDLSGTPALDYLPLAGGTMDAGANIQTSGLVGRASNASFDFSTADKILVSNALSGLDMGGYPITNSIGIEANSYASSGASYHPSGVNTASGFGYKTDGGASYHPDGITTSANIDVGNYGIIATNGRIDGITNFAGTGPPTFTYGLYSAGNIELGDVSDTTLSRSAAGKLAVEGVDVVLAEGTQTIDGDKTFTNTILGTATAANGLKSATTTVSVSGSTAPSSGQVLTATSSTAATWQTPSGGGGGGGSPDEENTVVGISLFI